MNPNQFLVRLEAGVWLADGDGDPPRTLVERSAKRFESWPDARAALREAKNYRPFANTSVRCVVRIPDSPDDKTRTFAN